MSNNCYKNVLIDPRVLVAFYNFNDKYHSQVIDFFSECRSQLVTTVSCDLDVL